MTVLPPTHARRVARDSVNGVRRPLRCVGCGYEIASYRSPPVCPMCRQTVWEPAPWRPFTRRRP